MNKGILHIENKQYSNAWIKDDNNLIRIHGYENIGKVFHGDFVEVIDNKCTLKKSNIVNKNILGILELNSKYKFKANKRGIERFKFIPIEKQYPEFLVSTKAKRKYKKNILVNIKFLSWNEKMPYGHIINILGEVDDINVLYDGVLHKYELLKKNININKNIIYNIKNTENYIDITKDNIISIDPPSTLDIDDAFSFYELKNNNYKIGIHISDVLGTLRDLNLESILNKNLTTSIYSPHKTINMLPPILSENILSLLPNQKRKAITLWINIENNKIISSKIEKTIIINKKKYSYQEYTLKHFNNKNSKYQTFINIVKNLNYKNLNYKFKNSFDAHILIEKLMIIYNCEACKFIKKYDKNPIYRVHTNTNKQIIHENLDNNLLEFLNIINSKSAEYTKQNINTKHDSLNIKDYIHFTSPIRRYVDCYNHSLVHEILDGISPIEIDIGYINYKNKLIKKAERQFASLLLGEHIKNNHENKFKGYIYEINKNKISIYLPKCKLSIQKHLIDKNVENIYNILHKNNIIEIINNQTKSIKTIKMFVLIDLEIYTMVNINPYKILIVNL